MQFTGDLKFDKMDIETKLAQEYMYKINNSTFRCIGLDCDESQHVSDAAKNKIYCMNTEAYNESRTTTPPDNTRVNLSRFNYLLKLAGEIEKNVNLFCQLEYLVRNKPIESTKLELTMILRYLHYAASRHTHKMIKTETLVLNDDSPLIDLGFFAQLEPAVDIVATENTAVICHLFTNLCRISGFESVNVGFVKNKSKDVDRFAKMSGIVKSKVLQGGCVGVVMAQSDIDSAVAAFLASPMGEVWGIRRILVQESAIERVKPAFAWKTRSELQLHVEPKLKSLSADVYAYDGKTFLLDYVGGETNHPNVVLIESFRTVKELLTMIEGLRPFCVSLWSSLVAESNEIAYGIKAPMVWVNDHAVIGEPNYVSLAYFSHIVPCELGGVQDVGEILKSQEHWSKLTNDERVFKVRCIQEDLIRNGCVINSENTQPLSSSVHVGAKDMIVGLPVPRRVYFTRSDGDVFSGMIERLLSGSGIIIECDKPKKDIHTYITRLADVGCPIRLVNDTLAMFNAYLPPEPFRVVHTNFGTIFAN